MQEEEEGGQEGRKSHRAGKRCAAPAGERGGLKTPGAAAAVEARARNERGAPILKLEATGAPEGGAEWARAPPVRAQAMTRSKAGRSPKLSKRALARNRVRAEQQRGQLALSARAW